MGDAARGRAAPGRARGIETAARAGAAASVGRQHWIEKRERSLIRSIGNAIGETLGKDVIALEQRCAALETELAELRDRLNQERGQRGLRAVPSPSAGRVDCVTGCDVTGVQVTAQQLQAAASLATGIAEIGFAAVANIAAARGARRRGSAPNRSLRAARQRDWKRSCRRSASAYQRCSRQSQPTSASAP